MARDDDALAAGFAARHPDALAQAYRRYGRLLYGVARHALGTDAAAEDCVHDALLRVWRSPSTYRPERGDLRGFLVVCVRNEAMTMLRTTKRRSAREERAERLEAPADAGFDVVDYIEVQRLRDALARLPVDQRRVLELAYYGNRTQAEIAEELDVPLGTVKSRLSAAIRRLAGDLRVAGANAG